jgi:hypothetical protein
MAEFVKPVIDAVIATLEQYTPAMVPVGYEPFVDFGRQFTGVVQNWPSLFVMPGRTVFDPDMQGCIRQGHQIQIKLAVTGATPDEVTDAAMVYVRAVHLAIAAADAAGDFSAYQRVFVAAHDYGPLYERGGGIARLPEMELIVEAVEAEG